MNLYPVWLLSNSLCHSFHIAVREIFAQCKPDHVPPLFVVFLLPSLTGTAAPHRPSPHQSLPTSCMCSPALRCPAGLHSAILFPPLGFCPSQMICLECSFFLSLISSHFLITTQSSVPESPISRHELLQHCGGDFIYDSCFILQTWIKGHGWFGPPPAPSVQHRFWPPWALNQYPLSEGFHVKAI